MFWTQFFIYIDSTFFFFKHIFIYSIHNIFIHLYSLALFSLPLFLSLN